MKEMFRDYRLHHVGVIAPDMESADAFMALMGLEEDYRGYVDPWSCWCVFTKARDGATIELVVADSGPLTRFNKGVGGVHHFAFEVESLTATMEWCAEKGMKCVSPEPVKGAGNFWCNFLNPVYTRGVQIEFVEPFQP
ncbi:VOC family protein [Pikeienuella piscinae]|uniref:VOC family protein n=1 Tax=Pikeienuella piscinae TaxID=2748098 RepID=A0A7L5C1W5_9RHOB|nr:VOC family protein [Pikeienuella piscinae]QIE56807.1 VOC family protein [Pikeienuella piscinae]